MVFMAPSTVIGVPSWKDCGPSAVSAAPMKSCKISRDYREILATWKR